MTTFEYRPIKKIVIDQIVKKSYAGFADDVVGLIENPALWVDGILLTFFRHIESDAIHQRQVDESIRYWDIMVFCKCDTLPKTIKRTDYHGELPVRNMQDNPVFVELAAWIKTQPVWEDEN